MYLNNAEVRRRCDRTTALRFAARHSPHPRAPDAIERYLDNAGCTEAVPPDDRAEVRGPALASSTVPDAIQRYLDNGRGTKAVLTGRPR